MVPVAPNKVQEFLGNYSCAQHFWFDPQWATDAGNEVPEVKNKIKQNL